jgi:predicted MFS family arabinose efflux permease
VQFTHIMDFMIVMPLGPTLQEDPNFLLDTFQFGLVVSAYNFSACLAGLFAASYIDRFDRKRALIGLYAGFAVGTLLCSVAPNYALLLTARVIAGAFGGVVSSLLLTIVGDAFPASQRGTATGIVMWGFSLASIAGLPVGLGLAEQFGWWAPFAAVGGMSVVILIGAIFVLPSMRGHMGRTGGPAVSTREVYTDPTHVRAYALVTALMVSSFMIAPFIATYLVANLGKPKHLLLWVYVFGGAATMLTLPLIGRLADRLGKLIVFQVMALATAVPILLLTHLPPVSFALCVCVTTLFMICASGRMVPGMALITGCALPRYRGSFMSVNSSVQQMAAGLAALLTGFLTQTGPHHEVLGFPRVGCLAAMFAVASVVLAARLRPAEAAVARPLPAKEPELLAVGRHRSIDLETPPMDTPVFAPAE